MLQWTLGCMHLFKWWLSLYKCPGMELLGHMVALFLVFKIMSILFSSVAAWILYFHQKCSRAPSSPHPLHHIFCWLFNDGHSYWCEMVSHCSFDLHFTNNLQCWASFHVPKRYTCWTFVFQIKSKEINTRLHNNCHINHQ